MSWFVLPCIVVGVWLIWLGRNKLFAAPQPCHVCGGSGKRPAELPSESAGEFKYCPRCHGLGTVNEHLRLGVLLIGVGVILLVLSAVLGVVGCRQ